MSCLNVLAQTGRIKGIVLDQDKKPVEGVNVSADGKTTTTDETGFYMLTVPAKQEVIIVFSHAAYGKVSQPIQVRPNEDLEFYPVLNPTSEQLGTVIITPESRQRVSGVTNIEPATIKTIPGANAGVENILKTLPGVNSNNELSTQYSVRGGNYDENLVYVNEVEVYRPFLIRSGQQEGLSFTNTDLVENVDFSAGGFQAKYGDKLSSVLDITYRTPEKFGASAQASLLGGSLSLDMISKDKKWTAVMGARYRDNSLLVKSQETKVNFRPKFFDYQANVAWRPNSRWEVSFLGNISINRYNYQPLTRQTNFGTIDEPIALVVFYEGQEKDAYETYFSALKTSFRVTDTFTLKLIGSAYEANEQEYFDIAAAYYFGDVNTDFGGDFGDVSITQGVGEQLDHARNDLNAFIVNTELKGIHDLKDSNTLIEWGFKYTREDIRDRLVEYQVIDSSGFSLNPPIEFLPTRDQPYTPYTGPLVPYQNVRALNYTVIDRFQGYAQWSRKGHLGESQIWMNAGVRAHAWNVDDRSGTGKYQYTFSPRAQFTIKPQWKRDMLFRLSGGLYHQPPMYRELRDSSGTVQPNVKAQQSIHAVFGGDYSFRLGKNKRGFKLTAEAYYKSLTDVNTYTIDNVRIRYRADNNAVAYAYGADLRLNGEFVPGTESWFSFGYMKTEENLNNRGYISRPTDQRLKFAALFQDFMPVLPSVKVYLNLVYNTGLPGGSPSYADPYLYQTRLRDYRRADVGFSYVFTENNSKRPDGHWLKKFKDLSLGFEIFNMFDNQNAITNTWVRDVYSKNQYGIPNYMTTRTFNVKISARL
ncbi:TonB-dependent receptor plug domain-containing protein [Flavobacterium sp. SE-s28]|uniref:TonB-dependent receptor plug domain-containing protein n=1 Tax=Flavobacterium silvaticum TaxID=1852020 RepID=A0A972JGD7_9FLAO|nr:TonB-dependent receptor plug domain-containing protein [Flavobacterium silvaticum]